MAGARAVAGAGATALACCRLALLRSISPAAVARLVLLLLRVVAPRQQQQAALVPQWMRSVSCGQCHSWATVAACEAPHSPGTQCPAHLCERERERERGRLERERVNFWSIKTVAVINFEAAFYVPKVYPKTHCKCSLHSTTRLVNVELSRVH